MVATKQEHKTKRKLSTDIQERAVLMTALQDYIESLPGTQAEKAKILDITQPRLNDLLKDRIDKFSLDAMVTIATKAGLRVNMHVHPVQIRPSIGTINLNHPQILSIFAPAPNELGRLDSNLGTNILLSLLRCEAIANGLSPKDVVLSLNINVKDGGIDAKVENSPTSKSLLTKGNTFFQIKTGPSFKPWQPSGLKKELFGKSNATPSKKLLGSEIKNCLDQNGMYALVTFGHDLLPNQHSIAVRELTKFFNACGYIHPKVSVYGQGQLSGELDKYPSLCLDLIGLSDGGFFSFKGWGFNAQLRLPLEIGNDQKDFMEEIRNALQVDTVQHIRVTGEPGIGKTRLIFESVSINEIAPSVIYVPTGEDFQKSKLFNELIKPDRHYSATLVIDDCDNRDRASIWSALKGIRGIKLITIDHGLDKTHDSSMKTIECPSLQEDQIKKILFSYLKNNIDLHNWAHWCSGSPRVAHAIGENLKSNPEDILKSPADVPIWDRYIIGHKEMQSQEAEQHRIVLRHIALFQRFGFESPVNNEGQFICQLAREIDPAITWGRFQTIVQHYRNKRILQGRHTLFIVPKALHIHLWVEFWVHHGRGFHFGTFLEQVPTSMKRWFLELFIYAHVPKPAQDVVKEILSPRGPFSDQAFFKSEVGLRFLNYLSEANPSATLALLERTIKIWTHDELYGWNSGRQDIVWALGNIVVWDELFIRATNILIPMALAENAKNSNNSKGLLLNLFSVGNGWAPTQASPSKKLPILKDLVKSTDASRRALGLELCKQWLETYGGFRMIGPEHQGLKPPIEFWYPKTNDDVYNYWREVLYFLRDQMKGFDITDRNKVADILVGAAKGILHHKAMSNEVMKILFELAQDHEINKKSLTQFVIWELYQPNDNLEKDTQTKIRQLDKFLTGTSLWERTSRYVLNTTWDEDYTFRGEEYIEFKTPIKRVKELAKEFMNEFDTFSNYITKLVRESGHRLPELGRECGILATSKFDEVIFSHIQSNCSNVNGIFIGGYFSGLRTHDVVRWETQLHRLLHNKNTQGIAIDCIWSSGFTESLLNEMLTLLSEGELTSKVFDRIIFGKDIKDIQDTLFQKIINSLLQYPDNETLNITIQLVERYYFNKESSNKFSEQLVFKILTYEPPSSNKDQMYGYRWNKIAKDFLKIHPTRSIDLLKHILGYMGRITRYGNLNYIAKIADGIVMEYPYESWKIISKLLSTKDNKSYEIIYWLGDTGFEDRLQKGAITYIPPKEIIDWIKNNTAKRLSLILHVLPKTLSNNEGGELTRLFIEEFCDDDEMARSMFSHFYTGGWKGPESSYLSRKRDSARQWMSEIHSTKIQLWLGKYIDFLSNSIETAQIQEERGF